LSTKIHVLCEGRGLPITVAVTPGQQHETTMVEELLDSVAIAGKPGRPQQRFATVSGDKGYDIPRVRTAIGERGATALIPHKRLSGGAYPPGSEGFDKIQYKRRNVVERLIGRLKECRHLAMRFDKLAESFRTFVLLGFIRIWIKDLLSYTT